MTTHFYTHKEILEIKTVIAKTKKARAQWAEPWIDTDEEQLTELEDPGNSSRM